ncbi:uncharacterized protein LOC119638036 isoform X2 [Glossina fuscipes]|uniref:Uncharacterized protein LOC119638036 isoform X2 n=1 Tax=Glossina fuscipes TaxID=7396 RepID=A0A9C5Z6S5_9MUSC|nr:uncharacterized protein LOC119638036 isoform X2 [Glossina fuscipes]
MLTLYSTHCERNCIRSSIKDGLERKKLPLRLTRFFTDDHVERESKNACMHCLRTANTFFCKVFIQSNRVDKYKSNNNNKSKKIEPDNINLIARRTSRPVIYDSQLVISSCKPLLPNINGTWWWWAIWMPIKLNLQIDNLKMTSAPRILRYT